MKDKDKFRELVNIVGAETKKFLHKQILLNAEKNRNRLKNTINDLRNRSEDKMKKGLVVVPGPSLHRRRLIDRTVDNKFDGIVITSDGAYVSCLRKGLIPDYVITLDPHPTRIVRWFGDPEFSHHEKSDDYFQRQEINVDFQVNSELDNKEVVDLVNRYGSQTIFLVSTTSPQNVVDRLEATNGQLFWFNPIVDDPNRSDSLTRRLHSINPIVCLNTGGNVGTGALVFTSEILQIDKIGLIGMDLGYSKDTPYENTQTYFELIEYLGTKEGIESCFFETEFPLTGETYFTDPHFFWYKNNLLEITKLLKANVKNCTEGGILSEIECVYLEEFLTK